MGVKTRLVCDGNIVIYKQIRSVSKSSYEFIKIRE